MSAAAGRSALRSTSTPAGRQHYARRARSVSAPARGRVGARARVRACAPRVAAAAGRAAALPQPARRGRARRGAAGGAAHRRQLRRRLAARAVGVGQAVEEGGAVPRAAAGEARLPRDRGQARRGQAADNKVLEQRRRRRGGRGRAFTRRGSGSGGAGVCAPDAAAARAGGPARRADGRGAERTHGSVCGEPLGRHARTQFGSRGKAPRGVPWSGHGAA